MRDKKKFVKYGWIGKRRNCIDKMFYNGTGWSNVKFSQITFRTNKLTKDYYCKNDWPPRKVKITVEFV